MIVPLGHQEGKKNFPAEKGDEDNFTFHSLLSGGKNKKGGPRLHVQRGGVVYRGKRGSFFPKGGEEKEKKEGGANRESDKTPFTSRKQGEGGGITLPWREKGPPTQKKGR